MNKFVAFALIGAAFSAPVLADPTETSFTRDGQTYYLTATDMGRYTRISGHDDHGRTFDFHKTGTRVTGHYDGSYVDFTAPQLAKPAEVAAR